MMGMCVRVSVPYLRYASHSLALIKDAHKN